MADPATGRVDPDALRLPWHRTAWNRVTAGIASGRMPHALLVTGLPGIGKDRFAQRLAMRLLCRRPVEGDACGECEACTRFIAGTHPDFRTVTRLPRKDGKAGELREQIVIDQVRENVIEALHLATTYEGWKIALITPAERMNRNAANALLKTLEEPAGRSLLVLVSANPARMSATIRSRCQNIHLAPPPADEAIPWVRQHGVADPALALAMAGGAPLAATTVMDGALFDARPRLMRGLVELMDGRGDVPAAAQKWAELPFANALDWLQTVVHDLIRIVQLGEDAELVNRDLGPDLQTAAQRLDWRALHRHLDELTGLRALSETPVVKPLQWESVMLFWEGAR